MVFPLPSHGTPAMYVCNLNVWMSSRIWVSKKLGRERMRHMNCRVSSNICDAEENHMRISENGQYSVLS